MSFAICKENDHNLVFRSFKVLRSYCKPNTQCCYHLKDVVLCLYICKWKSKEIYHDIEVFYKVIACFPCWKYKYQMRIFFKNQEWEIWGLNLYFSNMKAVAKVKVIIIFNTIRLLHVFHSNAESESIIFFIYRKY